ncbi:MAG: hypothetical protein AAF629_12235 [Chloroflexota bacterium]
MTSISALMRCPVCNEETWEANNKGFHCSHCQLNVEKKRSLLPFKEKTEKYVVRNIGPNYQLARLSILNQTYLPNELTSLRENVYPDQVLAEIAEGNLENFNMPSSTLAQILLEQLRETCFLYLHKMRRGHGPVLGEKSCRYPQGKSPASEINWQDKGSLFLTDKRLVFPSNSFTFIRIGRRLTSIWAFEDGIAVQKKGETHATYFVGCQAHEAAIVTAYIFGKVPPLRKNAVEPVPA